MLSVLGMRFHESKDPRAEAAWFLFLDSLLVVVTVRPCCIRTAHLPAEEHSLRGAPLWVQQRRALSDIPTDSRSSRNQSFPVYVP